LLKGPTQIVPLKTLRDVQPFYAGLMAASTEAAAVGGVSHNVIEWASA